MSGEEQKDKTKEERPSLNFTNWAKAPKQAHALKPHHPISGDFQGNEGEGEKSASIQVESGNFALQVKSSEKIELQAKTRISVNFNEESYPSNLENSILLFVNSGGLFAPAKVVKVNSEEKSAECVVLSTFAPKRERKTQHTIEPDATVWSATDILHGLEIYGIEHQHDLVDRQLIAGYQLPATSVLCSTDPWVDYRFLKAQLRLNYVLSKLNSFEPSDLSKWQEHNVRLNSTYSVHEHLRETVNAEISSPVWSSLYEILHAFGKDLLGPQSQAAHAVRTLHLCESRGSSVACLNHYLRTRIEGQLILDWTATCQSPSSGKGLEEGHALQREHPTRWRHGTKGYQHLLSRSNIENLWSEVGRNSLHFITANGSVETSDITKYETKSFSLILAEVVCSLGALQNGRGFVLKLFTITDTNTAALLYLLACVFEEVHLTKPITSPQDSPEKYVVCLRFKGIPSAWLARLLGSLDDDLDVSALLPSSELPEEFLKSVVNAATALDRQYIGTLQRSLSTYEKGLSEKDEQVLDSLRTKLQQRFVESNFKSGYCLRFLNDQDCLIQSESARAIADELEPPVVEEKPSHPEETESVSRENSEKRDEPEEKEKPTTTTTNTNTSSAPSEPKIEAKVNTPFVIPEGGLVVHVAPSTESADAEKLKRQQRLARFGAPPPLPTSAVSPERKRSRSRERSPKKSQERKEKSKSPAKKRERSKSPRRERERERERERSPVRRRSPPRRGRTPPRRPSSRRRSSRKRHRSPSPRYDRRRRDDRRRSRRRSPVPPPPPPPPPPPKRRKASSSPKPKDRSPPARGRGERRNRSTPPSSRSSSSSSAANKSSSPVPVVPSPPHRTSSPEQTRSPQRPSPIPIQRSPGKKVSRSPQGDTRRKERSPKPATKKTKHSSKEKEDTKRRRRS